MSLLLGLALAGCGTVPAANDTGGVYDPFESTNRSVFKTYLVLDKYAFRPAATAYRDVLPNPARRSVRNFMNNLDTPSIFANDVLRGRPKSAGITLLRATINSTAGIGGLFDVAEELDLKRHSNDFGKTLAAYGAGPGPYLFVLLFGPTNVRDLTGWVVDFFMNPFVFMNGSAKYFIVPGEITVKAVDRRERNIEALDELESASFDYYARLRDAYSQARAHEIREEFEEDEELPDF